MWHQRVGFVSNACGVLLLVLLTSLMVAGCVKIEAPASSGPQDSRPVPQASSPQPAASPRPQETATSQSANGDRQQPATEDSQRPADNRERIVGLWGVVSATPSGGFTSEATFEFRRDGTVAFSDRFQGTPVTASGQYSVDGDRLTLTPTGASAQTFTMSFSGDEVTLRGDQLTMRLRRK